MQNAIEIKDIKKSYPGLNALKGISFCVKKGSVHGFLGPNGAGKTTTMRIIIGAEHSTSGEVILEEDYRIGILPETPPLYGQMTVKSYLKFVKDIRTLDKDESLTVEDTLIKCGLESVQSRMVKNLSTGYKQRVGIAQAIIHNPEIIILDEPMVGLDPNAIEEIRHLIKDLGKDHTVLLSSHQLHEVSLICDELTIIDQGVILKSGSTEEIKEELVANQVLKIEVDKITDELRDSLEGEFSIELKEINSSQIELSFLSQGDFRKEVGRIINESGSILLGLSEKEVSLEDIFKTILKEKGKSHEVY